jgi:hypothetical protein
MLTVFSCRCTYLLQSLATDASVDVTTVTIIDYSFRVLESFLPAFLFCFYFHIFLFVAV